jgi:hypothetical protein
MSFFKRLFGRNKVSPSKGEIKKTLQKLEIKEKALDKKIEALRVQCQIFLNAANEVMSANPKSEIQEDIADMYLQKRKMIQEDIGSLLSEKEAIIFQRVSLEGSLEPVKISGPITIKKDISFDKELSRLASLEEL